MTKESNLDELAGADKGSRTRSVGLTSDDEKVENLLDNFKTPFYIGLILK